MLQPYKTDDLYFVADGTGGHVFAATYAEHQRNVKAWREVKKDRTVRSQMRRVKRIQNIPEVPELPENRLVQDAEENDAVELADVKEVAGELEPAPVPVAISADASAVVSADAPASVADSKTKPESKKAELKNPEKPMSAKPEFVPKVKPNFQQKDNAESSKKPLPKAA